MESIIVLLRWKVDERWRKCSPGLVDGIPRDDISSDPLHDRGDGVGDDVLEEVPR